MPIQRFIKNLGGVTILYTGVANSNQINNAFTFPNNPGVLRKVVIKLHWLDRSDINIDNRTPVPICKKYFLGNQLKWVLYWEYVASPAPSIKVPTLVGDDFWPYAPQDRIIDYGIMFVCKGADMPSLSSAARNITTQENGIFLPTFNSNAVIPTVPVVVPVAAPAGTGAFGPMSLVPSSAIPAHNHITSYFDMFTFNGGSTREYYEKEIDYLNIPLQGGTYFVQFASVYPAFSNVNTGQGLLGTVEFFIEY